MPTISVQDLQQELKVYANKNKSIISAQVYTGEVELDKYCKKITAVKGEYPQFHSILSRVVQGFKPEWQALGKAEFKARVLKNYRQKVNFEILPDEVYATWLSDLLVEGKKPQDQPIAKFIMDELMQKITDDVDDLSQTGIRDDLNADGQFGKSLDGVTRIISKGLVNTTYPMFKIPLNAITTNNRIEEIEKFERSIPKKVRKKIIGIFVSEDFLYQYKKEMQDEFGTNVVFTEDQMGRTLIGKIKLIGLRSIPDSLIFATVDENLAKLIDLTDNPPAVTDVQVQDYIVKLFMEFHLGYDFLMNHLVFVAVFDGSNRGFNNAVLNERYYDSENLTVTP